MWQILESSESIEGFSEAYGEMRRPVGFAAPQDEHHQDFCSLDKLDPWTLQQEAGFHLRCRKLVIFLAVDCLFRAGVKAWVTECFALFNLDCDHEEIQTALKR